jgi:hypothetical protein
LVGGAMVREIQIGDKVIVNKPQAAWYMSEGVVVGIENEQPHAGNYKKLYKIKMSKKVYSTEKGIAKSTPIQEHIYYLADYITHMDNVISVGYFEDREANVLDWLDSLV